MTETVPVNGQKLYIAKALSATATTVWTFGKFQKTSTGSGILGPQIGTLSPWQDAEERVYINVSVEPTLIEDRSAAGQDSIYEYTLVDRGIDSDNKDLPPTLTDVALQKAHKYGASFILPISAEYFTQLSNALETATSNRAAGSQCFDPGTPVTVGDERVTIPVPSSFDGTSISRVVGFVNTAGATGATTVQIHNVTTGVDVLSTPVTITDTDTSGQGVVDITKAVVSTDDILRVDIDGVTTTAPLGLVVNIEFEL